MKKILTATALAVALLGSGAASAAIVVHVGPGYHHGWHHSGWHRHCGWRHGHRHCW
ncbi:MAG TPA: hypothetical protein VIJ85_10855 [Rhizomicrobium sp.]